MKDIEIGCDVYQLIDELLTKALELPGVEE